MSRVEAVNRDSLKVLKAKVVQTEVLSHDIAQLFLLMLCIWTVMMAICTTNTLLLANLLCVLHLNPFILHNIQPKMKEKLCRNVFILTSLHNFLFLVHIYINKK